MHYARAISSGLSLGLVLATVSPSLAGPAVASRWWPTALAQEDCLKLAEAAISNTALTIPESTQESRYGTQGEYTGVVRCVSGKGLIVFIGSGPSRQTADQLAGALLNNFRAAESEKK
jgi:hypothetical protein